MFCKKCGNRLNDHNICPICNQEKVKNPIFVLAIISLITSFLAFHLFLMILGMIYSLIVLIIAVIKYKRNPMFPKIGLSITLSSVGLITNLIWYVFSLYLL